MREKFEDRKLTGKVYVTCKFEDGSVRISLALAIVKAKFEVKAIGLTMEQIIEFDLPPNPTKLTDSRANAYIEKYGKTCWEVDALKPHTLTGIIEWNIEHTIDMDQYESMLSDEQAGIDQLKKFINAIDYD
jgi:hypothetical protein